MKKFIVAALALLLTTSLAYAGPAKPVPARSRTHVVATEVVKADVEGKMLTVKGPNNTEMTMPCEGKAVAELKAVTVGEKVSLVCKDNAKGEHQAIVGITAARPAKIAKAAKAIK